jgi:hypothetical protein
VARILLNAYRIGKHEMRSLPVVGPENTVPDSASLLEVYKQRQTPSRENHFDAASGDPLSDAMFETALVGARDRNPSDRHRLIGLRTSQGRSVRKTSIP